MARRDLPNAALWGFEYAYARMQEVERELAAIMADNTLPRAVVNRRVQAARLAVSKARERIVEVHPRAPQRAPKW